MATIGVLSLALRANTAGFNKGFKKAGRTMRGFTRGARSLRRVALGLGAALAGVLGVRALKRMVQESFRAMDATAKLADRIEISTEALVGLQHAAQITGLEVGALNKNLQMMQRRVGEASQGTGEAKEAFELLGLKTADLLALSADKQLLAIAGAMEQLGTSSEKASVAADIFGRSGVQMLNMLNAGEGGMRALMKQAEALGVTFTRLEAGAIEKTNDALTRLKASMRGVANRAAVQLAPVIQKAANRITTAFVTVQFAVDNWAAVTELGMLNVELATVKFVDRLEWAFLKAAPTILEWARDNWKTILADMTTTLNTGQRNLGQNLEQMFFHIDDVIRGDMDWEDVWVPLTDGLVTQLDNLPDIPKFVGSEFARQIKAQADALATRLGGDLNARLKLALADIEIPAVMDHDMEKTLREFTQAVAPGAFERGTREAYSAALAPRQQAMQRYFAQSLKEEQVGNKHLQNIERLLGSAGAQAYQLIGVANI